MSTLTPSNRHCRLFGKGVDCVDKQSINGDRTTTRSFNKVALNRFGIAIVLLGIAKLWLMNSIGSLRCEASKSDAKQTIDDEAESY
jgi:hypothetical protein